MYRRDDDVNDDDDGGGDLPDGNESGALLSSENWEVRFFYDADDFLLLSSF